MLKQIIVPEQKISAYMQDRRRIELTVAEMKRLVADTLVRNFGGGNNSEG